MFCLKHFQHVGQDLFVSALNNTHSGNMSIRDNRMMAITRSGAMLHRLEYNDIIETLIDEDDQNTALASSEKPVHASIYKNTSANAIVHAHSPCTVALSDKLDVFIPKDAEGAYYFPNGVSILKARSAIASNEVATGIISHLAQAPIAIVKGHGVFSIGNTLIDALHWITALEHSAKILFYSRFYI